MTAPSSTSAAQTAAPVRIAAGFAPAVGIGALLGAAAWLSDQLAYPWSVMVPANAVGAWVAIAFVAGALAPGLVGGVLRGLSSLLGGIVIYELLTGTLGYGVSSGGAFHASLVWGAVACVIGPVYGAAGATWPGASGRSRSLAVGLLAATLVAEGVAFGGPRLVSGGDLVAIDPGALILAGEIALGLLLPWVLLRPRERRDGYVALAVLAIAAALAIGPTSLVIRSFADRF